MKKETPCADIHWIPDFQEKYAVWFREAKVLLDAHQYPAAFKTYPFPIFEQTPWAQVRTSLAKGCLGIVSTAALYRQNIDTPFSDTVEGDSRVLELPGDVKTAELTTSHAHIPQDAILADVNVALPLDALRAMVRDKQIGEIAPRFFSLNGYRSRADEVATQTAAKIAAAMADDGATHALIVPVWPICHQTGGLVAREIEARGISTVTMANIPGRMEPVRPPRWVYVRFPRGAMFGEPGNASKHRKVLEETLKAFESILSPGGKIDLPYRWEAPPVSWRGREITEGA